MGTDQVKSDQTLDCVGFYCPMPIIKTAERIKKIKTGEILEVVSDDKGIVQDMPAWCKATGHELVKIVEKNKEYHVFVRKTHD